MSRPGAILGAGAVLLAIVILLIAALAWQLGDSAGLCANEPIATEVSPDGTLKAVLFRRNCGATTSYSTQLSIIPAKRSLPNEPGNIFVQRGEATVAIHWIDAHPLRVSGAGAGTASLQLADYRGIQITYE